MIIDKIKLIIKLGRIHFLVAGFILYVLGVLLAVVLFNQFSWDRFIWGYAVLLPAHLMVNYSNEYFDRKVDRFSTSTNFSGGSGVLLSHPELKRFAKYFSLVMILISLIIGFTFGYLYNSPIIFLLAISGNLLGWFYSAPPLKFSYRGFGEIATVLSGFLVPGLGYAAITGVINIQFIIFSIPIMLSYILFILSVEIPDRESDQKGGKYTLIVRYGYNKALLVMVIASALASATFLLLPSQMFYPINLDIMALLSMIPLVSAIWALVNRNGGQNILNKSAVRNVNALILFIALTNIYFIYNLIK